MRQALDKAAKGYASYMATYECDFTEEDYAAAVVTNEETATAQTKKTNNESNKKS